MIAHSDGGYAQIGFSPAMGMAIGKVTPSDSWSIAPKFILIHDFQRNLDQAAFGGQISCESNVTDVLRVAFLAQIAAAGIGNESSAHDRYGSALFYHVQGELSYKLSNKVRLIGSAEVTDADYKVYTPDGDSSPAVLVQAGAVAAF